MPLTTSSEEFIGTVMELQYVGIDNSKNLLKFRIITESVA